jgi:hypothetical protein
VPDECALIARELHEPLPGTAPEAVGWLCIEQPGPWGRDAVLESRLDPGVAAALVARAAATDGVRLQLVRRVDDRGEPRPRRAFLVHAGVDTRWVRRVTFSDADELRSIDLACLLDPGPPDVGEPHADPLLLVCTNARRDACCARWGRPVATELAAAHGEAVWEASHVGGHRFAGNLVILPHGLSYGFLQPEDALRVVRRHLDGLIDLETLRGRSALDRAGQAAEWYVRDRSLARGLDEVVLGERRDVDGAVAFTARVGDTRYDVRVRHEPLGTPRLTGCDKDAPTDPGTWVLDALEVRPG